MSKVFGSVLTLEDGTEAQVLPLREDRGALVSLALFAVLALGLTVWSLLF